MNVVAVCVTEVWLRVVMVTAVNVVAVWVTEV